MGMFFPIVRNDDPALYATIAKNIANSNDFIDLISEHYAWLDKPHLPFWLTALSFQLFGISGFSYILPGFIFYLCGLIYTYRLTLYIYQQENLALLACLLYVTTLHLMISLIDLRAETYMLGEIMPASYYFLIFYDHPKKWSMMIKGAIFSAFALMTKGIFSLITISSGLISLWIYKKEWHNFIQLRYYGALILCFIFTLPELIALYLQFDLHPELSLFNQTHVSGIKWFFIDSQWGRFLNNGPIASHHGNILFFMHSFLWSALPWSFIFISAIYQTIKNWPKIDNNNRNKYFYLWGSFFPTFIVFSLSKFQLDYYINIILPFVAIIGAVYIYHADLSNCFTKKIFIIQKYLTITIMILGLILAWWLLFYKVLVIIFLLTIFVIIVVYLLIYIDLKVAVIGYGLSALNLIFIILILINAWIYIPYDPGYQIALYLNAQKKLKVYDFNAELLPLELYSKNYYQKIYYNEHSNGILDACKQNSYIVSTEQFLPLINKYCSSTKIIWRFSGAMIDKVMRGALLHSTIQTTNYIVLKNNVSHI